LISLSISLQNAISQHIRLYLFRDISALDVPMGRVYLSYRLKTSALRVLPMIFPCRRFEDFNPIRITSKHTKMRNVIAVRQRGCDQDVLPSFLGQSGILIERLSAHHRR
jgi:hypothetical protein